MIKLLIERETFMQTSIDACLFILSLSCLIAVPWDYETAAVFSSLMSAGCEHPALDTFMLGTMIQT